MIGRVMIRTVDVHASWDAEAGVWVAEADGLGLVTEAASVDDLRAKLPAMAADLLADELPGGTELRVRLRLEADGRTFTAA